jgi:phenylpropionate dioxygenase-like ring-hydroxylating dioxygenase large terminal subunit
MKAENLLFDNFWHLAAHSSELSNDLDYVRFESFLGEVVVCNDAGRVFAFDNICPHRGTRIFTEDFGNRSITCGYHGWTYREGKIIIPRKAGFLGEDLKKCRYATFDVARCGEFIFVSRNPGFSLQDQLGSEFEKISRISQSIDGRHDSNRYIYECNWKTGVENALESYHLSLVHPGTLGKLKLVRQRDEIVGDNSVVYFDIGDELTTGRLQKLKKFFELNYQFEGYSSIFLFPFSFISSTFGYSYSIQRFFPRLDGWTNFSSTLYRAKTVKKFDSGGIMRDFFDSVASVNRRVFEEDHEICKKVQWVWPIDSRMIYCAQEKKIVNFHESLMKYIEEASLGNRDGI